MLYGGNERVMRWITDNNGGLDYERLIVERSGAVSQKRSGGENERGVSNLIPHYCIYVDNRNII